VTSEDARSVIPLEDIRNADAEKLADYYVLLTTHYRVTGSEKALNDGDEALRVFIEHHAASDEVLVIHDRMKWEERCKREFCETTQRNTVRLRYADIAAYLREHFNVIAFNGKAFIYHQDQGIYQEDKGELEQVINDIAQVVDFKESISKATREILHYVLHHDVYRDYPFNPGKDIIPVKNGVVQIDYSTGNISLIPHSPEHRITFVLPVIYDEGADGSAFHEHVISQYVDPEIVDVLYMIPAISLLQFQASKPYKKAFILQGDANGGKTTYLEWLTRLFGAENIARASLHHVCKDRFINGNLEGKLLNAYDDLSDIVLENVGPFKTLTGGFDHMVERKHADPYQSRIFAVHCFSCNAPPDVPERVAYDAAFWERWEYLHFQNIFETDPGFNDRMFTEDNISGSFNKVLQMMVKIRKKGLPINSTASETKEAWQTASDPLAKFLYDHTLPTQTEHLFNKPKLLRAFQRYCEETMVSERKIPRTLTAFSKMTFKNGFKDVKRGSQEKREWYYMSCRTWKPDSQYAITDEQERSGPNNTLDDVVSG
jgi:putative DNA primase/helicase